MSDEVRIRALVSVLLVEAIGAIAFGVLGFASREFLGEVVPLWIPVAGMAFGLAGITAAVGVARGSATTRGLTVGTQAVAIAGGVLGFAYSRQMALVAAILLGGFGLWLFRGREVQQTHAGLDQV